MEDNLNKVSVVKCDSYLRQQTIPALHRAVDILGGFKNIIRPDHRVLIKPNLLLAAGPEKAVTTHPRFLESLIEILASFTDVSRITIADSPGAGIPFTKESLEKVYQATGMMEVAQRTGCVLNFDTAYISCTLKQGKAIRKVDIIKPALEADRIINLCKLKTHNLTSMTGAVKNMFGLVPGYTKIGHHLRFTQIEDFSQMLVDIAYFIKPSINIMDAVLAMEGEGPGVKGTPRHTGLILASRDPLAMDVAAASFIGLNAQNFALLGLEGVPRLDEVEIVGDIEKGYLIENYLLPRNIAKKQMMGDSFAARHIMPRARSLFNPYPVTEPGRCTLCGTCQEVCPNSAIKVTSSKVLYDYNKCIRCFCCSELCPEGAIDIRYKWWADLLLNKAGWAGKKDG
ncbi:MAG: DUF362 domain-containing protein [Actinomycetota bacterium]|nr:DUF362 domain-containing protein [Actinomycetota bacterium]